MAVLAAGLNEILGTVDLLIGRAGTSVVTNALTAARPRVFELAYEHLGDVAAAKALTVKILNLALARHEVSSRALTPLSRPFGLTLDPANGCHLHCPGCVHSADAIRRRLFDWPAGMLTEPILAPLFRKYGPYAVQAMFCNYGEPLLNPATPSFIKMARRYLMQTMLSTSMSVRNFDAEAYALSGLDYMIVSIDGATQPVYERYRRNGNLDLALANIASLVAAKRRLGLTTPVLCWQFLAFEHNAHEIDQAIECARQLGLDEFTVTKPFEVAWDDPTIRSAQVESRRVPINPYSQEAMMDNWRRMPEDLDAATIDEAYAREWCPVDAESNGGPTCRWLYKNLTMDAGGRIFPCCGAPQTTGGHLIFSRIGQEEDPFNSDQHRLARQYFAAPADYARQLRILPEARAPFCAQCQWADMPADIDGPQVATYLRAAGQSLFSAETIRMLSSW